MSATLVPLNGSICVEAAWLAVLGTVAVYGLALLLLVIGSF